MEEKEEAAAKQLIGAAIGVHKELGPGYHEPLYEEALAIELGLRQISYSRQRPFAVDYKGYKVGQGRLDLLVDECVIVDLKTVESLAPVHLAQMLSYLKAMKLRLGLIINFNVPLLKEGIRRVVL